MYVSCVLRCALVAVGGLFWCTLLRLAFLCACSRWGRGIGRCEHGAMTCRLPRLRYRLVYVCVCVCAAAAAAGYRLVYVCVCVRLPRLPATG